MSVAENAPTVDDRERLRSRLPGWVALAAALAALNYAGNLLSESEPRDDLLYLWSSAVAGVVQYAVIGLVLLVIARGLPRDALGLRRPPSWGRAAGLVVGALVAIWIAAAVLNVVLEAGEEQGLVPDAWDGSRWAPFLANAVVVAVVAPVVEELCYRAIGMAVVGAVASSAVAVGVTGLAFGLAHGLIVALPILTLFGIVLGWLRLRTESVYPCMILHGIFNGAALLAAVTVGGAL
ncbi:MAG: lysostaphin resistance A-like protein [Gaiella sp.]